MTVVVGTAGHIDHGKTLLLRALTGIDADRLPEEQRRGMTIDVGYAHMRMDDGSELDFVDVPGHDRLIGNMLVGAGEIDAALLVVAADDGPRAQTIEHLELLDALGLVTGLVVITKTDTVPADRVDEVVARVRALLAPTSLAAAAVVAASSVTLAGLAAVRGELALVQRRVLGSPQVGPARLWVDRVFSVRGRGTVVTGSLRGAAVARGDLLRVEPTGGEVRIREVQVHNRPIERTEGGGRVALNVAGIDGNALRRGLVLTSGPGVERTQRILVALRHGDRELLRHGLRVRLHLGTDQVDGILDVGRHAAVGAGGRLTAIVRLDRPIAAAFGDAFVLRRPSPGETIAGGRILDPLPPRGVSRRRLDGASLGRVAGAAWGSAEQLDALVSLHGALDHDRAEAWAAVSGGRPDGATTAARGAALLAPDVIAGLEAAATAVVTTPVLVTLAEMRAALRSEVRRRVTLNRAVVAPVVEGVLEALLARGDLLHDGNRLLPRGATMGPSPDLVAAMDRLERALAVPAPPSLTEAAAAARCPKDGIRALEAAGRIVRVEDDLAWEVGMFRRLEMLALSLASTAPLSPAAFRDATGTSRRYALAILEDLGRRRVLQRTPGGHVPGPRADSPAPVGYAR